MEREGDLCNDDPRKGMELLDDDNHCSDLVNQSVEKVIVVTNEKDEDGKATTSVNTVATAATIPLLEIAAYEGSSGQGDQGSSWNDFMAERNKAVSKRIFGEGNPTIKLQHSVDMDGSPEKEKVKRIKVGHTKHTASCEKVQITSEKGDPAGNVPQRVYSRPLPAVEIPSVVEIIASHVETVTDLKTFRSVCPLWKKEAMGPWRKKAVLVLNKPIIQILLQAYQYGENVEKDLPLLKTFPFINFRFPEPQWWKYPLRETDQDYESKFNLWKKVLGIHAKFLDIGQSKLRGNVLADGETTYILGIQWILNTACHLQTLQMQTLCDDDDDEDGNDIMLATVDLDQTFYAPNLTTLHLPNPDPVFQNKFFDIHADAKRLLNMMPNLRHVKASGSSISRSILVIMRGSVEQPGSQLQTFQAPEIEPLFQHDFEDCLIRYLENYKNVQELKIPMGADVLADNTLEGYRILNLVSASIHKLTLQIDVDLNLPSDSKLFLSSLAFPYLTDLIIEVEYKRDDNEEALCFPFETFVNMPNLQRFAYQSKRSDSVQPATITGLSIMDSSQEFKMPQLTHFKYYGTFTNVALQQLGQMARNIRDLQMAFLRSSLPVLTTHFRRLQSIRLLHGSKITELDKLALSIPFLKIDLDSQE